MVQVSRGRHQAWHDHRSAWGAGDQPAESGSLPTQYGKRCVRVRARLHTGCPFDPASHLSDFSGHYRWLGPVIDTVLAQTTTTVALPGILDPINVLSWFGRMGLRVCCWSS